MNCEIKLSRNMVSIVDADMFDYLSSFKWNAARGGPNLFYARRYMPGSSRHNTKFTYMHHVIAGRPIKRGMVVDHINGNSLDNRRCNLRIVTEKENHANQIYRSSPRIPGPMPKGKYWVAKIKRRNGEPKYVGAFESREEALAAFQKAHQEDQGR